jgi:hypothetical protein
MRSRITATVIGAAILIGGYAATQGGDPGGGEALASANIYMSTSAGIDGCTRANPAITYTQAVAGGNVCKSWWKACDIAVAGDVVGVKDGTYPATAATQTGIPSIQYNGDDGFGSDCSNGSGADYDPNWREKGDAEGSLANWVTFRCADDENQDGVVMGAGHFRIGANAHARIYGGCFHFSNVMFNYTGETIRGGQNVIFEGRTNRLLVDGFASYGGKNVMLKFWEAGPWTTCGQDGGPEPEAAECNATTPVWEAKYASRPNGNSDFEGGGQIPKFTQNSSYKTLNGRSEDGYSHDHQSRDGQAPAPDWHGGCGMAQFNKGRSPDGSNSSQSHNIVIDRHRCERVMVFGFFIEDADGVTYQNSVVGCPADLMQNSSYVTWNDCIGSQPSFSVKSGTGGWTPTNILVRYNSMYSAIIMGGYASNTNVRVIGNVATNGGCESTITFDRNAWTDASTCTDGSVLSNQGDPWVQKNSTEYSYPPSLGQVDTEEIDYHLSSGTKSFENWITETSSDYALTYDYDGDARTSGSRDAGADER